MVEFRLVCLQFIYGFFRYTCLKYSYTCDVISEPFVGIIEDLLYLYHYYLSAFNPTPASTGTSLFGQQPQATQQQNTSLFGQSKPLFGASTSTGTSGFSGFGATTSTPSLFGQSTQNKVHVLMRTVSKLELFMLVQCIL